MQYDGLEEEYILWGPVQGMRECLAMRLAYLKDLNHAM